MKVRHFIAFQREINVINTENIKVVSIEQSTGSRIEITEYGTDMTESDLSDRLSDICFRELMDECRDIRKHFKNHIIYEIYGDGLKFSTSDKTPKEVHEANKESLLKLLELIKDNIWHDNCYVEFYSCIEGEEHKPSEREMVINLEDNESVKSLTHLAPGQYLFLAKFSKGRKTVFNKTINVKEKRIHALAGYCSYDRFYIDFISEYNKSSLPPEKIYEFSTVREQELFRLAHSDEAFFPVERIAINGEEYLHINTSCHYIYSFNTQCQNDPYIERLYEYYDKQGLIPDMYIGKGKVVLRAEYKSQEPLDIRDIRDVRVKFGNIHKEYPVQLKFKLPYGEYEKGLEFEYSDPVTDQKRCFYADSLTVYDIFKDLKDENLISHIKRSVGEEKKLLIFGYEKPEEDVYLNFRLTKKLDSPVIRRSSSGGIGIIGCTGNTMPKNGYRLSTQVLDHVDDFTEDETEIELFTITKITPLDEYFQLH